MKIINRTTLFILLGIIFSCQEQKTEVVICSSIHGLHKENPNYSYEDLFDYIDDNNPELLGVEVRQEDVDSSTGYLEKFYPFEMHEIIRKYESKLVLGFDWLGSSIEGKSIPENYFKELDILKLQKAAAADSLFQANLTELEKLADIKNEIASTSTIFELNSGKYDSINSIYYHKLDSLYEDTPYSKIANFYRSRDINVAKNIMDIVSKNRGKSMIFILGADHRSRAIETFQERFGNDSSIRLIKILND